MSGFVGETGIGQRHIASGGETVAYMAARAAEEALSDAGMRPEEIDFLLVSTMSSERIMHVLPVKCRN